jgi:hypothetical protein
MMNSWVSVDEEGIITGVYHGRKPQTEERVEPLEQCTEEVIGNPLSEVKNKKKTGTQ